MDCIICGSWFASTIHDEVCPTCSRAIKRIGINMTPNRLIELARAEKDGRLVVLPPNDPLTLDELREMDGEPVYDWMGYEWFVVSEVTDDEVIMTDGTIFDIDEDSPNSSDQRFYRRKLEEVDT